MDFFFKTTNGFVLLMLNYNYLSCFSVCFAIFYVMLLRFTLQIVTFRMQDRQRETERDSEKETFKTEDDSHQPQCFCFSSLTILKAISDYKHSTQWMRNNWHFIQIKQHHINTSNFSACNFSELLLWLEGYDTLRPEQKGRQLKERRCPTLKRFPLNLNSFKWGSLTQRPVVS